MLKITIKILLICLIILFCLFAFSYASDSDFDDSISSDISQNSSIDNTPITGVNTISSIPEANLGLNNILNILLIAVGFLIILLAIAILIKLNQN